MKKRISASIDEVWIKKIKEMADKEGRSFSSMLNNILTARFYVGGILSAESVGKAVENDHNDTDKLVRELGEQMKIDNTFK